VEREDSLEAADIEFLRFFPGGFADETYSSLRRDHVTR